ncbi:hypothetical protein VIGAN_11206800 [Vigna angularis var. angularis]|uniref:Uncharacterized protein n=1 Tax=Vigna angularis var. angularis TaxID=157739 RepID=A0A0S3TBF2_PHAAN|nr:hypothetical protein VIGAN_11206800 [Vigna angularis var. angularis]
MQLHILHSVYDCPHKFCVPREDEKVWLGQGLVSHKVSHYHFRVHVQFHHREVKYALSFVKFNGHVATFHRFETDPG